MSRRIIRVRPEDTWTDIAGELFALVLFSSLALLVVGLIVYALIATVAGVVS